MPDERKPVMCPWCKLAGNDGVMAKQRESVGMTTGEDYYVCPERHSHSPHIATSDGNWDNASNDCYLAATRTPPNLPLTREQVEALPNDDAVWVYTKTGTDAWVHSAYYAKEYLVRCGGDEIYFAAKPTEAEVDAARKERGHYE